MWKKIPLFLLLLVIGGCSFVGSFAVGAGDDPLNFTTWKPYALGVSALTSAIGLALSLFQMLLGQKPVTLGALTGLLGATEARLRKDIQEAEWAVREVGAEGRAHNSTEHKRTREEIDALKAELLEELRKDRERPLDAEEEARVDQAVERILSSNDARLRPVEEALQNDRVDDAYSRLMGLGKQSQSGASDLASDAFQHFSTAGALYLGRDTAKAIEAFEAARDALPSHFWTHVELSRLYLRAGRTEEAETAARAATAEATNRRDETVAANTLGDVLVRQGRSDEALTAYEEGLDVAHDLLASDPGSAEAKRDVSVSLNKVGDVLVRQGRTEEALTAYEEGLSTRRDLLSSDPGSAEAKRDVSVSLDRVGDVLLRQGRAEEALKAYEEGLSTRRALLASDPGSAEAKRDVVVSLAKLGELAGEAGRVYWAEAHQRVSELHAEGRLDPADAWMLEDTAKRAGITDDA
ncbi:MAG: tetratricopeptide repeat protein [Pseudomonadota bacterium]